MTNKNNSRHDKKEIIKVLARCPKCGKEHWYQLTYPWIGNGQPRVYCPTHQYLRDQSDPIIDKHNVYT